MWLPVSVSLDKFEDLITLQVCSNSVSVVVLSCMYFKCPYSSVCVQAYQVWYLVLFISVYTEKICWLHTKRFIFAACSTVMASWIQSTLLLSLYGTWYHREGVEVYARQRRLKCMKHWWSLQEQFHSVDSQKVFISPFECCLHISLQLFRQGNILFPDFLHVREDICKIVWFQQACHKHQAYRTLLR